MEVFKHSCALGVLEHRDNTAGTLVVDKKEMVVNFASNEGNTVGYKVPNTVTLDLQRNCRLGHGVKEVNLVVENTVGRVGSFFRSEAWKVFQPTLTGTGTKVNQASSLIGNQILQGPEL